MTDPDDGKYVPMDYYRAVDDLAREMHFIHQVNDAHGWSEFGFIPANEPNIEWYKPASNPAHSRYKAWQSMDRYFVSLYDYVQDTYGAEFRVFTPPMAQANYAEGINIEHSDCPLQHVKDVEENDKGTGYENMRDTYETAIPAACLSKRKSGPLPAN